MLTYAVIAVHSGEPLLPIRAQPRGGGGDLGEIVFLSWLASPYFELREKVKCIEHRGKSKLWSTTSL